MYRKVVDFSRYSSIKIGPKVEVLMIEKDDEIPKGYYLVGGANNLLISPTPPPLMMLSKEFSSMYIEKGKLVVGASVRSGQLLSFAKKNNIAGFEFLSKLPGSIGGIVAMNAGVKSYEVFNLIEEIKIGNRWIPKQNINYGYRFANLNGVVTEVKFKLKLGFDKNLQKRLITLRGNQPKEPSAGSAFKNPKGEFAGKLIEAVGLKGFSLGGMAFSKVHSNFLINLNGGTFDEALKLLDIAKERVFEEFGIFLEEEIIILNSYR